MIEPLILWATAEDSPLATLDSQFHGKLVSLGYHALHDVATGAGFRLVQKPGPGVIRIRAAFTEADKANNPLKEISALVPHVSGAAALWSMYKG